MKDKLLSLIGLDRAITQQELEDNSQLYEEYSKPIRPWVADYVLFGIRNFRLSAYWLTNKKFGNAAWIANCWNENNREYETMFIRLHNDSFVKSPEYPLTQKDKQFILRVYKAKIFNIFE